VPHFLEFGWADQGQCSQAVRKPKIQQGQDFEDFTLSGKAEGKTEVSRDRVESYTSVVLSHLGDWQGRRLVTIAF
jgi:hypothetical protein